MRLFRESTLAPQFRHNAIAQGSLTHIAGPLDRLTFTLERDNKMGASPRPCPVWSLLSQDEASSLCAALALVHPRWQCIRDPSRYHPEGYYTSAKSPRGGGVLKQVNLAPFEPMVTRIGPRKMPKCLENGPFWDQKRVENG